MKHNTLKRLNKNELIEIAYNIQLSNHSKEKLLDRLNIDYRYNLDQLRDYIINSDLAYVNTDNAINIAFSKDTYLVVAQFDNYYRVITFKEPSKNYYTVYDKYNMALKGIGR